MSTFDDFVLEQQIRDSINMYHISKEHGENVPAHYYLHRALRLRRLKQRRTEKLPCGHPWTSLAYDVKTRQTFCGECSHPTKSVSTDTKSGLSS